MKMARIKGINKTEKYLHMVVKTSDHKETDDCSVKAIAIVCDIPYEEALKVATVHGRKPRRGMKTGQITKAVESLGFKLEPVDSKDFIAKYPAPHNGLQNVTTHHPDRFQEVFADGHKYLFYTKGHILAVVNGANHDHTRGKKKFVKSIWRVL
jgi:hypothetical protein